MITRICKITLLIVFTTASEAAFCEDMAVEEFTKWEQLCDYWEARSSKIPPIQIEYEETTYRAAGTLAMLAQPNTKPFVDPGEITLKSNGLYIAEGKQWRWELRGDAWEGGVVNSTINRHRVMSFDGERRIAWDFVEGEPSLANRSGWLDGESAGKRWSKLPQIFPLRFLNQPLAEQESILDRQKWTPSADLEVLNDGSGDYYRQRLSSQSEKNEIIVLIDPAQGYGVISLTRGRLSVKTMFEKHQTIWIPQSWTCTTFKQDGSGVENEITCRTTKVELLSENSSIDFSPKFPAGLVVTDSINEIETYYTTDQQPRRITQMEWDSGIDFDKLGKTKEGELASQLRPTSNPWYRTRLFWLLLINVGVILIIVAMYLSMRTKT